MELYLYLDRGTFFHRLDPRTKLLLLFVGFAVPWLFGDLLYLFVIMALIFVWIWAAKAFDNVRRIRLLLIIFIITTTLMWALMGRGPTRLLGPISLEGIIYGFSKGIKIDCMTLCGLLFLSTTRNEEISMALVKLGLSYKVSLVFSLTIRLIPLVAGTGAVILQAQRSRGLDVDRGNIIQRARKYVPLIVPMLISTVRGVDTLAMALEAKAFGTQRKRTFLLDLQFGRHDQIVMAVSALVFVAAMALRMSGFGVGLSVGT
jgi:energy-coupling factor transport system permease protein